MWEIEYFNSAADAAICGHAIMPIDAIHVTLSSGRLVTLFPEILNPDLFIVVIPNRRVHPLSKLEIAELKGFIQAVWESQHEPT